MSVLIRVNELDWEELMDDLRELRKERKRYRRALLEISNYECKCDYNYDNERTYKCRSCIAKEALENK